MWIWYMQMFNLQKFLSDNYRTRLILTQVSDYSMFAYLRFHETHFSPQRVTPGVQILGKMYKLNCNLSSMMLALSSISAQFEQYKLILL